MPETKRDSRPSGRLVKVKMKAQVLEEAARLGHEIGVRAAAVAGSPHPRLALEQLEADLETAGHLARDVRRLIGENASALEAPR